MIRKTFSLFPSTFCVKSAWNPPVRLLSEHSPLRIALASCQFFFLFVSVSKSGSYLPLSLSLSIPLSTNPPCYHIVSISLTSFYLVSSVLSIVIIVPEDWIKKVTCIFLYFSVSKHSLLKTEREAEASPLSCPICVSLRPLLFLLFCRSSRDASYQNGPQWMNRCAHWTANEKSSNALEIVLCKYFLKSRVEQSNNWRSLTARTISDTEICHVLLEKVTSQVGNCNRKSECCRNHCSPSSRRHLLPYARSFLAGGPQRW